MTLPTGTSAPANALSMRDGLRAPLAPVSGERVLEVGAGGGQYALHVAGDLLPGGTIDPVDGQPQMLDDAVRNARERGFENVAPVLGDARYLPFQDGQFDAAYIVAGLGDTQDPGTALRELARVVRPGGRVIVGELEGDPHRVDPPTLSDLCAATALRLATRVDLALGYLAVLEIPRP
jgi:ubiquinone/menaquinone biosynthesis C-methylase UbiE